MGYLDNNGVLNYFLPGGIDMDDSASMLAFFENYVDGLIKYTKNDDILQVVLRKSRYRILMLGFIYKDNDGIPQSGDIYFTRTGCRYLHDLDVVRGCTDSTALNYDSTATEDDGSCVYTPLSVDDVLRSNVNIYNLDKSKTELIDGASPCCCSLTVGRFVNRVVEISQRISNNQVELATEVQATATLDFSEYDLSTLTNDMNIEVVIVFVDGSVVVLTNFFGDLFGMNEVDFLTLLALNVNLDNPDVSCVYSGSGFIIELVAAPDYGASINLAEVKINFVDYLDLGTSVDTGQVFLPGKPAYFGGKAFIPDCNNFNRMYVADPTGASATLELNHSFTSLIIFPGTEIPVSTAWASAFEHAGYRSYKRIFSIVPSYAAVGSQAFSICKDPSSSYDGVVFYAVNNITIQARYPNGTLDTCPGILPFATDAIHAVSAFGGIVRIFVLDTYGQTYGFVDYAGIGAWSIIPPVGSGSITYLAGGADVEYIESTEDFIFATGSSINRVNALGVLDAGISFAGNNEVLTKDPISGIIYCSSASALGSVGSATINKLNPLTMTYTGTIVLPFVAIGKIGLKKAALIGDVRYYICEYDTATIHVMDGNFTEVDTIVVTPKTGVPIKVGACVYDEMYELLIVRFSDFPNYVMNRSCLDAVIDVNTKEIQNILFPNGQTDNGTLKGLNLNVYNGIYGYLDCLQGVYIWEYVDRQNIVGQVILSSNPGYLFYWDILPDLSLVESAFEMMIHGSAFEYKYAIYNNILEKLISRGGALANISFFDNNQVGYISQLISNDGLIYLLTTDNGTEAIADIKDIVINAANGKFAVLGTSSPTAVGLAVFTNTTFVYLDCVPELDTSILTAGFNTDTGELWVLGINGGLKTIAIYDTALTLVSTFTIFTGVGGTFELIFDLQNNVMFLHQQGIGKVYIYQQNGTLTNTLNVTTKYPTLVGPNSSLRYYANGVSYGLIYESASEEVHFFPIQIVDAGDYTNVGLFNNGVDVILQTEDDECLTFQEKDDLIEVARQLIINCSLDK